MNPEGKSWYGAIFSHDADVSGVSHGKPPALGEFLLMLVTMFALHLLIVSKARNFWDVAASWMDNPHYLALAAIIRHGHLLTGYLPPFFMNYLGLIIAIFQMGKPVL